MACAVPLLLIAMFLLLAFQAIVFADDQDNLLRVLLAVAEGAD